MHEADARLVADLRELLTREAERLTAAEAAYGAVRACCDASLAGTHLLLCGGSDAEIAAWIVQAQAVVQRAAYSMPSQVA
jgi:hypothetical protein